MLYTRYAKVKWRRFLKRHALRNYLGGDVIIKFEFLGFKISLKKEVAGLIAAFAIVTIVIITYVYQQNKGEIIIETGNDSSLQPTYETGSETDTAQKEETIKVYVTGCVKEPGVITLKKGQIISDAIEAAGGATEDADIENINLVYILNRNVMLRIKSKNEAKDENISDAGPGLGMIYDSAGAVTDYTGESKENSLVNINTASLSRLQDLPGIGEQTAKSIVDFRNENGIFEKAEDIMMVPGIKESKFRSIKDFITVD